MGYITPGPDNDAVIDAIADYGDALIERDLAKQVEAIRRAHRHGADVGELCSITDCSPDFIRSLLS